MKISLSVVLAGALLLTGLSASQSAPSHVNGWLNWRGPMQDGTSLEKGLPDKWVLNGENDLWNLDLSGAGTPVIANGHLYAFGYRGKGPDLREVLMCVNADTGKKLWEKEYNDFISDIVYDRYAIGSPCIDPATGDVFVLTSPGLFGCYTPDGKLLWMHSLMEEIGKLTFTNGRTGGPWVDGDLVYIRGLTSNWGGEGAGMDRFYAFDTKTGQIVFSSGPGTTPKDNSFAMPVMAWRNGKRVFYSGTGCGHFVCVNARTGEPIWRYALSAGGMNSSLVMYKNMVIGVHADENLDSSEIGRMTAVRTDVEPEKPKEPGATPELTKADEAWRNRLESISSTPVVAGNRLYLTNKTGQLCAVDADNGTVLWKLKLGPDQLHASPLYADGKLYIPMHGDTDPNTQAVNGVFYIVKPDDTGGKILSQTKLEGVCLGAPAVWNGKVYVLTTAKLYCFGRKSGGPKPPVPAAEAWPKPGPPVALQILPSDVFLRPGDQATFTVRGIDANGLETGYYDSSKVKWEKFIPATAKVKSEMDATFNDKGVMTASNKEAPSAGAFEATLDGLKGHMRGRILPAVPFKENFSEFDVNVPHATEAGVKFAYPPLPWIGARFKWEVREVDGEKVLTKTLDNIFFQRSTVFFGHPDDKNYTAEADVRADGNRRTISSVGLINQRYYIILQGNQQELEVSSNQERLKVAVPFAIQPKVWYRLKTRVDVSGDGSGVVRARLWKRGDPEPDKWTIEVPVKHANLEGAPGLFGFAPQSLFRCYVGNISVTPNSAR